MPNGDLTNDFSRKEFACKCGCGFDNINPRVVLLCQELRDALGKAITVNSGCRCAARNRYAGSTSKNHVNGNAADITCGKGHIYLWNLVKKLYDEGGMKGLKFCLLEGSWVHIDVDRDRSSIFQKL